VSVTVNYNFILGDSVVVASLLWQRINSRRSGSGFMTYRQDGPRILTWRFIGEHAKLMKIIACVVSVQYDHEDESGFSVSYIVCIKLILSIHINLTIRPRFSGDSLRTRTYVPG
jgi:hypothetical protein